MRLSNTIGERLCVASGSDGCPLLAGSAVTAFDLANFAWAFGKAFSEMATSTFDYEHEVQQEFDLFMKNYLWRMPAREQVDPCLLLWSLPSALVTLISPWTKIRPRLRCILLQR